MSRDDLKRRVVTAIQRRFVNPVMSRVGSWMRGSAVLETIGRRTGLPRQTPVGGRLIEGTFWLVAEHGREADYVRNLEKNSRVRILVDGEWRKGTASVERSTDPRRLLRRLPLAQQPDGAARRHRPAGDPHRPGRLSLVGSAAPARV